MKTMKKVLAFMLALAMVVTAVPVTNAEAATGLPKSKSYYAGKTYTLKLTTPSSWKSVSTKWSATNNNTKAVAISDKKAKSVTVKALKKGKAVVTAKVTYKKSGVATTKTYKCNVRVKAPTISASPKQVELKVGETKQLTVKYVPASAIVSYKTSNADVATVTKDGLIKAVSAKDGGEAVVTAVLRCGKKVKESPVKVVVTVDPQEDGLHASVTNLYDNANYPDTVVTALLGNAINRSALVAVYFGEGGKGVAHESVVLNWKYDTSKNTGFDTGITDANGYAYFNVPMDPGNWVDKVTYTASLGKDATKKYEGKFQFGVVSVQSLVSVNGVKDDWSFVYGGTNYVEKGYDTLVPAENDALGATAPAYTFTGRCATHGVKNVDVSKSDAVDKGVDKHLKDLTCPEPGCGKTLTNTNLVDGWDTGRGLSTVDGTYTNTVADWEHYYGTDLRYETTYVDSQQVSDAGKDNHKVGFVGGLPFITLPGDTSDLNSAVRFQQDVNMTSETYGVYDDKAQFITLKCDPNELTYATLNFENLSLSKYTKMVISTWKDEDSAKKPWDASNRIGNPVEVQGPLEQTTFGYQIPIREKNYSTLCVRVELVAAGQVNTDKAKGYTIKDITGVYKNKTAFNWPKNEYIKGAKIEWSLATPVWSNEMPLGNAALRYAFNINNITVGQKDEATNKEIASVSYRVPVYPYTGNAVITTKDKNGAVIAYFAVPTKNDGTNQNVLDPYAAYCYRISEEEAFNSVGTFSQDGNLLTVNSDKSGVTTLAGKITGVPGLDATNDVIYTSVQWNPVQNATIGASGAIAFAGQDVEVVAQLIDKNGNRVSTAGKPIKFKYTHAAEADFALGTMLDATGVNNVSVMSIDASTDSKGQAKLLLSAAKANTVITNIAATTSDYTVAISVNGSLVEKLDLYWVEAKPAFTPSTHNVAATPSNDTTQVTGNVDLDGTVPVCEANVGENWEYGFQVAKITLPSKGVWGDAEVTVKNVKIGTAVESGSKGTVTLEDKNGAALVTSTEVGKTTLIGTVDGTPVSGQKVQFEVNKWYNRGTFDNVGEGVTSFSNDQKLSINWQSSGLKGQFVDVSGQTAVTGQNYTVYFKVTDTFGNKDIVSDVKVVNTTAGTIDVVGATSGSAIAKNAEFITKGDANGLIAITVSSTGKTNGQKEIITVNVNGIVIKHVITWKNATAFAVDTRTVNNNTSGSATSADPRKTYADNKKIVLTMTDDVLAGSVIVDQFTVTRTTAGGDVLMEIASVEVSGKTITLNFKNAITDNTKYTFKVTTATKTVNGVDYTITSKNGVKLTNLNNEVIYFAY